jgi:predicted nuclease of predicted toxin-antitoxin system
MKLFLDEHYANEIAVQLRAAGHDAVTVSERGLRGTADEPLLTFAASEERALLTNNARHLAPLAARWAAGGQDHVGLLFTSDASMPRGKARIGLYVATLNALMDANSANDALRNQIRWLPYPSTASRSARRARLAPAR